MIRRLFIRLLGGAAADGLSRHKRSTQYGHTADLGGPTTVIQCDEDHRCLAAQVLRCDGHIEGTRQADRAAMTTRLGSIPFPRVEVW
jgi:hypothetical protein